MSVERRGGLLGGLFGLIGAGLVVALLLLGVAGWFYLGPGPSAREGDSTVVVFKDGSSVAQMGRELKDAGVIRSPRLFRLAAKLTGADRRLRAGEYQFQSGASLASVVETLRSGKVVRHFVTVPEGRTVAQAIRILQAEPVLVGEVTRIPPEGSILPETYEITRGETRQAVIDRMRQAQEDLLADLWPKRQAGLPFDTQREAVTLASIVEKETGIARERPEVAAVFVNRLRQGMRLESDPTIIYGITKGEPLGRGIRASEIRAPHPWNTYVIDGIPPSPIANPGRDAIAAVLNPPSTRYLFFVADGTGGHDFSVTYAEHSAKVARLRQLERRAAAAAPATTAAGLR